MNPQSTLFRRIFLGVLIAVVVCAGLVYRESRSRDSFEKLAEVETHTIAGALDGVAVATQQLKERSGSDEDRRNEVWSRTHFELRVKGDNAIPIHGALIRLLSHGDSKVVAQTDSNGLASIRVFESRTTGRLMISAEGYANEFLDCHQLPGATVDLVLTGGAVIEGLVRRSSNVLVGSGVRVVAVPLDLRYTTNRTPEQVLRCEATHVGITDEAGRFRIEGLRDGSPYWMDVADDGTAINPSGSARRVVASQRDLILTLDDLFTATVRFSSDDADYMKRFFRTPLINVRYSSELQRFNDVRGDTEFGRMRSAHAMDCDKCLQLFFLRTSPSNAHGYVVSLAGSVPGFAPFKTDVQILPMGLGAPSEHIVELKPLASGGGALELHLMGEASELIVRNGMNATLTLERVADAIAWTFPVSWSGGSSLTSIENIPAGTYNWSLSMGIGGVSVGNETLANDQSIVEVSAGATSVVEVPLPALGYIEVHCMSGVGPVFAVLAVAKGNPSQRGGSAKWIKTVVCSDSPQLIGPLEPGLYELLALEPGVVVEGAHHVDVIGGGVQTDVLVFQ